MSTLNAKTIAATYDQLVKRADTYVQAGTNIELMTDSSGTVAPTGLYLESGATTDNVGIGTATPASTLHIANESGADLQLHRADSNDEIVTTNIIGRIKFTGKDASATLGEGARIAALSSGIWTTNLDVHNCPTNMHFYTQDVNDTDTIAAGARMTILSTGLVGLGIESPSATLHVYAEDTEPLVIFESDDDDVDSGDIILQLDFSDDTNIHGVTARFISFHDAGGEIGYITTAADGSVNAITTSDVRLKKDIVYTSINGLSIINALKIRDFTWNDKAGEALEGLEVKAQYIADEVYEVYPLATTGTPGAMKDILDVDGNKTGEEINRMGVGESRLISVLIKSVQELSASNDALKARIEVLEA